MFVDDRPVIGMVHVRATPGSPRASLSPDEVVQLAVEEASQLFEAGISGVILENMHDTPYVHGHDLGPEVVATMTRVAERVRPLSDRPIGIQILSGGNRHAIAIAHACGLDFIRCENFVFAHVADEGLLERAEAGELLRYRRSIGAERVRIFADIKKKHASHAITADLSLADSVQGAEFFGADGIIVTGTHTGVSAELADLKAARVATRLPVLVGSGVTAQNLASMLNHADAVIVGSSIKDDGHWANPLDLTRVRQILEAR